MDHKSGYLVILCCALIHMTTLGSDMIFYHTADQDATTIYLVSLVIAYLLYPLLGWMADVYFTTRDTALREHPSYLRWLVNSVRSFVSNITRTTIFSTVWIFHHNLPDWIGSV